MTSEQQTFTLRPVTAREGQIGKSLGVTGWRICAEMANTPCLNGADGRLIEKSGHSRWVRTEQLIADE